MILSSSLTPCRITNVYLTTAADNSLTIHKRAGSDAFRVNVALVYIWQLCDGTQNIGEITDTIRSLNVMPGSDVDVEVSNTIGALFSRGLLDFSEAELKPFATIAFSDLDNELSHLHHFLIHMLGRWFDLHIVGLEDDPAIYISIGNQGDTTEGELLRIYVSDHGEIPSQPYDFIFTRELSGQIPVSSNLLLPRDALINYMVTLSPEDIAKLDVFLGKEEDEHEVTAVALNQGPLPDQLSTKGQAVKKLTIGMATYDDYDGVYFSVQAIRLYHPEVTEETEILVIDNNPSGPCATALRDLASQVPGYRYIAVNEITGTAVRDFVFREAETEYVMCIDSHVFIQPGAIRQLIDYFESHPDTPDLLQGPLLGDNLKSISTHFEPAWREGMYGFWSTDKRGINPTAAPFDIPMQGLGLAACRKSAWLGYNPRFRGFGGEEGYIHQKFRNTGARTLCLPFLRWVHRFARPMGTRYPNNWEERIRNYMIGFEEVGLDQKLLQDHFREITSCEAVDDVVRQLEDEKRNPFTYFDAIYCINLDHETSRWEEMKERLERLKILPYVKRISAVHTPESGHIGCALSHRSVIQKAKKMGYKNVLVLEDDALFHADTWKHLENALSELEGVEWNAFYLGGMKWGEKRGEPYKKLKGCSYLEHPVLLTCTHAIAYNSTFFDTLLNELPGEYEAMKSWLTRYIAIDQYLTNKEKMILMTPVVAIQPNILGSVDEAMHKEFS